MELALTLGLLWWSLNVKQSLNPRRIAGTEENFTPKYFESRSRSCRKSGFLIASWCFWCVGSRVKLFGCLVHSWKRILALVCLFQILWVSRSFVEENSSLQCLFQIHWVSRSFVEENFSLESLVLLLSASSGGHI